MTMDTDALIWLILALCEFHVYSTALWAHFQPRVRELHCALALDQIE